MEEDWPLVPFHLIASLSYEQLERNVDDVQELIAALGSAHASGPSSLVSVLRQQLQSVQGERQRRDEACMPTSIDLVLSTPAVPVPEQPTSLVNAPTSPSTLAAPAPAPSTHLSYSAPSTAPTAGGGRSDDLDVPASPRSIRAVPLTSEALPLGFDPYAVYGTRVYEETGVVLGPDSVGDSGGGDGGAGPGTWSGARARAAATAAAITAAAPLASSAFLSTTIEFVIAPNDSPRRRKKRLWEKDKSGATVGGGGTAKADAEVEKAKQAKERAEKLAVQLERQVERAADAARAEARKRSAAACEESAEDAARAAERRVRVAEREARAAAKEEERQAKAAERERKRAARAAAAEAAELEGRRERQKEEGALAAAAAALKAEAAAAAPPAGLAALSPVSGMHGLPCTPASDTTGAGGVEGGEAGAVTAEFQARQGQECPPAAAPSAPPATQRDSAVLHAEPVTSPDSPRPDASCVSPDAPSLVLSESVDVPVQTPGGVGEVQEVEQQEEEEEEVMQLQENTSSGTSEEPESSEDDGGGGAAAVYDDSDGEASGTEADEEEEDSGESDASSGSSVSTDNPTTGKMRYSAPVAGLLPLEEPPPPEPSRPPSYADLFPDFASIFTGCGRGAYSAIAGGSRMTGKSTQLPITPDAAAGHQLKLLYALRAWREARDDPTRSRASDALRGMGPEAEDHLLLSTPYGDAPGDDERVGAKKAGVEGRPTSAGSTSSSVSSGGTAGGAGRGRHVPTDATHTPPRPAVWYRAIDSRDEVYSIFHKGLGVGGVGAWWECPSSWGTSPVWSLAWSWSRPPIHRHLLLSWQRVNHFKSNNELARKDLLKRNLSRYAVLGAKMAAAWALQPPTFILPKEYLPWCEAFGKAAMAAEDAKAAGVPPPPNVWIMKPVGLSRGRGIRLVSDIGGVRYSEPMVIQKYVGNPLTLDGYKFDLRIYVAVTSFQPLEAFIYRRGFARMSTEQYSLRPDSLDNKFVHLTNAAVQKGATGAGDVAERVEGADAQSAGGSKISLELLWRRLRGAGVDVERLWEGICDVVVKSLLCADDVIPHQPNSFELFGYDVLIDSDLKPWLIEVNSSPSLAVDSPLDDGVKSTLVRDTLRVVDPLPYDHAALERVLERRVRNATAHAKGGPHAPTAASGLSAGVSAKLGIRAGPGSSSSGGPAGGGMSADDRLQLDKDLSEILYGRKPRQLGELPAELGQYQRLAPGTAVFARALQLKMAHIRGRGEVTTGGSGAAHAAAGPVAPALASGVEAVRSRMGGAGLQGGGCAVGGGPLSAARALHAAAAGEGGGSGGVAGRRH